VRVSGAAPAAAAADEHADASLDDSAKLDPNATPPAAWRAYSPSLAPAPGGREHKVTLTATERVLEVAPGVEQQAWSFDGIVGAQARWAIVAAAGGQPGGMEGVHGGPVRARDGDMGRPTQRPVDVDEEVGLAVAAEAHRVVALDQEPVAERIQRLPVERPALLQVADPQADVVDHQPFSFRHCRHLWLDPAEHADPPGRPGRLLHHWPGQEREADVLRGRLSWL
jgi:hypothetical protein